MSRDLASRGSAGRRRGPRREVRFLAVFALLLAGGFALVSLRGVNDHAVEPFTAGVARASGAILAFLGQEVRMRGTIVESPRFAVNVRNGCNGVEAMLIFLCAVLAYPARWRSRMAGLAAGAVAIPAVNLVRVVALFLTGAYLPRLFDVSHTLVWQTLVVLFAVLLWVSWARRLPGGGEAAAARPVGRAR